MSYADLRSRFGLNELLGVILRLIVFLDYRSGQSENFCGDFVTRV